MSNALDYRAKAAEFTGLARKALLQSGMKGVLRRARYYGALAAREERVVSSDKSIANGAPAAELIDHVFAALDRLPDSDAARSAAY